MSLHEDRYAGQTVAADYIPIGTERTKESRSRLGKSGMLPFLSVSYILNGNHDPRKVQRLNIFLSIVFLAGGLLFQRDLMPIGFLFAGVALVNGINSWYIRNLGDHSKLLNQRDILSQIELCKGRAARSQHPTSR